VGEDIEGLRFNTAVSQLMIFVNEAMKIEVRPRKQMEQFILLLAPFAPHLAEEIWQRMGHRDSLAYEPWPSYDPAKTIEENVEVILQVNGKVRSKIEVARDTDEKRLEELARQDANIRRYLDGKRLLRTVVVKNKLVNIVVAST
jgi:leucyl-tRNA synthetase